jgi:hypothetical protein
MEMKTLRMSEDEYAKLRAKHNASPALVPATLNIRPPVETPKQRMQALGRLPKGTMNKTEAAYAAHLDAQRGLGAVLWFRFEGLKLRLADSTFYDTDFAVMVASGQIEIHEVKGFMTDDANVKLKVAASQYPFVFKIIRRAKGGNWDITEV